MRCQNSDQEENQEWEGFVLRDEMAQRYTVQASIAWICMCFFCIGVVCSAIQEILIVLICRSYPIAFGLRVQRILPKLLQKKSTAPRLATEPAEGWNAPAMFQRLNFEDSWAEAELVESCIYLRGSVHLKVPARWKRAFPTHV